MRAQYIGWIIISLVQLLQQSTTLTVRFYSVGDSTSRNINLLCYILENEYTKSVLDLEELGVNSLCPLYLTSEDLCNKNATFFQDMCRDVQCLKKGMDKSYRSILQDVLEITE